MHSVQRRLGKYMRRTADETQVSVLLKDFEDADQLLAKIIESSRAWREAWILLLTHQHRMLIEFDTLYKPIVGAGPDYHGHVPVETPEHILVRTARLKDDCEELKTDLTADLGQVDSLIVQPAQVARDTLQAMRKTIKKREDKKLDYERYQSRVDAAAKKNKPSDRDRSALAKAQADLSVATDVYNAADEHLRQTLPPILVAVFSLQPHLLAAQIQIQNSLLGHFYTTILNYCTHESFPNPPPPMDEVIRTWSDVFKPLQTEIESLPLLVNGKAVRSSMQLEPERELGTLHRVRTRTPSAVSLRSHSVSPARALTPSPSYDIGLKAKRSAARLSTAVPQQNSVQNDSATSTTVYATPLSTPLSSSAASASTTDYFSLRGRQASATSNHSMSSVNMSAAIAVKKKPPPPPPPRAPSQQPFAFVTALYDFGGQGEGDLVFREGDRIKVLKSTERKDDWWQGELRGVRGAFPANYCQ
ncbi:hypothetical protein DV738_g3821, partial [Chaetothyriales sp. CBS 135597]